MPTRPIPSSDSLITCSKFHYTVLAPVIPAARFMEYTATSVSVENYAAYHYCLRRNQLSLTAPPIPRRNGRWERPQTNLGVPGGPFGGGQLGLGRVLLVVPREARLYESNADVGAVGEDHGEYPSIPVGSGLPDLDGLAENEGRGESLCCVGEVLSWFRDSRFLRGEPSRPGRHASADGVTVYDSDTYP